MKLNITKGKQKRAVRCCIYGAEGIGKSTLAAKLPEPLFIDAEGGTFQIDCSRFDQPKSWSDLMEMVTYVIDNPTICKTLVIDTADKAEVLLQEAILREYGVDTIEKVGGGYGKGYTLVAERFQKELLYRLDKLIQKGINVCFTAHATMRKFESPEDAPYDRWELKCSKKISPLIKEWVDLLLFCDYQVTLVEEGNKTKAKGSGKRMMHANHKPTYDAKNRYGLPDDMPLDYAPISAVFAGNVERIVEKSELDINSAVEGIVDDDNPAEEDIYTIFRRQLKTHGIEEDALLQWIKNTDRGEYDSIDDMSELYLKSLNEHIDLLKKQIEGDK